MFGESHDPTIITMILLYITCTKIFCTEIKLQKLIYYIGAQILPL